MSSEGPAYHSPKAAHWPSPPRKPAALVRAKTPVLCADEEPSLGQAAAEPQTLRRIAERSSGQETKTIFIRTRNCATRYLAAACFSALAAPAIWPFWRGSSSGGAHSASRRLCMTLRCAAARAVGFRGATRRRSASVATARSR